MEKYLSVIMPAYNEGACIYENALLTSQKIAAFCREPEMSYEIIVMDDGSSDDTIEEAQRASLEDKHIRVVSENGHGGKGRALCIAAAFARGKYIAFCDADLDLDPSDLEAFLAKMREFSNSDRVGAVIGSKLHPGSHVDAPMFRKIYSRGYAAMLKVLFRCPVSDTQTGLKLFRGDVLRKVCSMICVSGFAFDAEIIAILSMNNVKVVSMPVTVKFTRGGEGRIGIKDVIDVFKNTLGIFVRLRVTHYYRKNPVNAETLAAVERAADVTNA